ncbi:MAG TPA: F0F1 ATP synthase subunit A, partial [Candidatus Dependentiae bacterium]|nr:F0F1 ATP synthase subunit A [Candidatus Dependentiae bacterium]
MNNLEVAVEQAWHPLAWLGVTHPFFTVGHDEIHVIIQTWIILLILFLLCLPVRWILKNRQSILSHLILSGVNTLIGLCKQAMGKLIFPHFAFVSSIFIFIFVSNIISILPWMEEPTQNINTTLALSLTS